MLPGFGSYQAPPELLAALREIDPAADLVHLGDDAWLLGVRQPNAPARARLDEQLTKITRAQITGHDAAERALVQAELAKEVAVLQLCADGFRPIHLYHADQPGWGRLMIEDFRLRDFNWRTRREAAVQELREEISFDHQDKKRTNLLVEFFEQEGSSLWHKVMRRAKSFLQPRKAPA